MKMTWTGVESAGKSLQLSVKADEILRRNEKWLKKTGKPRTMAFNTPMAPWFVKAIEDRGIIYKQWRDLNEVLNLYGADIFIDEIIKYFPATGSAPLTPEQLHFLTQGAKSGNDLYSASQDFSQVHKQFRLLTNVVYVVTKFIGSPRPHPTRPKVKRIWGVCFIREVNPMSFKGDSVSMETAGLPSLYWITREDCERFDTSFKVPMTELPVKHLRKQREIYKEEDKIIFEKVKYV